ncbi:MAG: O-Antigen ligase [Gaiellales bacterium]|nr:O-Antigen ligase [Gaiellales bacterium]
MTPRARSRTLDVLLLATLTVTTWAKIHWSFAGQVALEDILAILFLIVFAFDRLVRRDWRLPSGAAALVLVLLGLEVVFLLGFFDLSTRDALDQYAKGMTKYLVHFVFLIAGVAHIVRRGKRFHLLAVGALCGGITLNAVYGVLQLLAKVGAGVNLDKTVVGKLTQGQGGVGGINVFGQATGVQGGSFVSLGVFRVNALALDPNHLGIMLCVPILVLLPFSLRMGMRSRRGIALAAVIAFCTGVEILTLSRSGALGLAVGLLVLAIPLRRKLFSPKLVVPVLIALVLVAGAASQSHYVRTIIKTRVTVSDRSAQVHYQIFALVPPVLDAHPLLGLGLNTFSVYYEFQTGRTDWGPHSFYVALIAETGLIGTTVFGLFLIWLLVRLAVLKRAARMLARAGDPDEARAGPLADGLLAALLGTMAANVFYLTMQFYYFYALVLVIVAAADLYAPAAARVQARAPVPAPAHTVAPA